MGVHQEKARGQYLTGFLALTLRAFGFKPILLFFEGSTYFKNGLALFALIIIKRHSHTILASGMIGKGSKVDAQQSADFAIDLAQEVDRLFLGLGIGHDHWIALHSLLE